MGQLRVFLLGALWIFFLVGCSENAPQAVESPEETARLRERLNKIFYWQVADELKLTAEEEKKLIEVLESFQARKEKAMDERHASLRAIEEAVATAETPSEEQSRSLINRYRAAMAEASQMEVEQLQALEKIMGPQKLLRFLKSRREMSDKILEAVR